MAGDRKAKTTRVSQHRMLYYKNVLKFLFKTAGFCDHLRFTWKTVPLCWAAERKGRFAKFCMYSLGFRCFCAVCGQQYYRQSQTK